MSVTLRSIDVQSGMVRWTGSAAYPDVPADADQAVVGLAHWALWHATCPTERGYRWVEPTRPSDRGCVAPLTER